MHRTVEVLTLVLLLRFSGASIPPVLWPWIRSRSIAYVDELHAIFCGDGSTDAALDAVQKMLYVADDLAALESLVTVLRDCWSRVLRKSAGFSLDLHAASVTLISRWHRRTLTYAQRADHALQQWHLVPTAGDVDCTVIVKL